MTRVPMNLYLFSQNFPKFFLLQALHFAILSISHEFSTEILQNLLFSLKMLNNQAIFYGSKSFLYVF